MQTVWHFGYFWPVVVYLESKIMYRSGKIQWWPCKIELKHTKTKARTKNKEETLVSAIFGPIVTKWIPKSVYFCRSKQWWSHIKQRKTKPKQAQTNNLAKKHMFFCIYWSWNSMVASYQPFEQIQNQTNQSKTHNMAKTIIFADCLLIMTCKE